MSAPVTQEQLQDVVKNITSNIVHSNNEIVQNLVGTANNLQEQIIRLNNKFSPTLLDLKVGNLYYNMISDENPSGHSLHITELYQEKMNMLEFKADLLYKGKIEKTWGSYDRELGIVVLYDDDSYKNPDYVHSSGVFYVSDLKTFRGTLILHNNDKYNNNFNRIATQVWQQQNYLLYT